MERQDTIATTFGRKRWNIMAEKECFWVYNSHFFLLKANKETNKTNPWHLSQPCVFIPSGSLDLPVTVWSCLKAAAQWFLKGWGKGHGTWLCWRGDPRKQAKNWVSEGGGEEQSLQACDAGTGVVCTEGLESAAWRTSPIATCPGWMEQWQLLPPQGVGSPSNMHSTLRDYIWV